MDEVFAEKPGIPEAAWRAVQDMSFFMSKLLRHDDSADWAPKASREDRSMPMEVAYNEAIYRNKILPQQDPGEIYAACKLRKKDTGRPRFHLLVREPSREEIAHPLKKRCMIKKCPWADFLVLRIRTVSYTHLTLPTNREV